MFVKLYSLRFYAVFGFLFDLNSISELHSPVRMGYESDDTHSLWFPALINCPFTRTDCFSVFQTMLQISSNQLGRFHHLPAAMGDAFKPSNKTEPQHFSAPVFHPPLSLSFFIPAC